MSNNNDYKHMRNAVDLAKIAYERGYSPVGAVLVKDGHEIDEGISSRRIGNLLHAEYQVMVANQVNGLAGMTLYTTLEPCLMCTGMAIVGKIDRVVFLLHDFWGSGPRNINQETEYMRSRKTVIEPYSIETTDDQNMMMVCLEMWKTYLTKSGHEWAIQGMLGIV